ncbi:SMI1/KNR4 family protein [Actinomadura sp. WMMB 499]|uniref:SMI1/KNR4 family protein n=1 Tax=Actinomadura sp. WMMB 499 TaxID=1219491 RepID=UPI0012479F08|nr:SMI1/KNR4 family protein [Actinomadura sp. WMMB 499]QFG23413.1 SMI1/KNR4 family protein [Actinomadura sp. WMMB 499]
MTDLERLLALVPPPAAPVGAGAGWTRAEDALGVALPREFTEIARRYGRGTFCDEFSCHTPELMIEENPGRLEDLRFLLRDDGADCPHPVHPEPGGLLVWGSDSIGGALCWLTEPAGSPDRWPTVRWTRDDEFEYPEGGTAAVLTGLTEDLTARMAESGADVDGPWFDPDRRDVHVYLRLTEVDGAPPYPERLRILRRSLAPTGARGGFTGAGGARQDHFATAAGRWRLTYETAYGHQIRVAYPPGEDAPVRAALLAAVDAMGCRVESVLPVHGTPHWPGTT